MKVFHSLFSFSISCTVIDRQGRYKWSNCKNIQVSETHWTGLSVVVRLQEHNLFAPSKASKYSTADLFSVNVSILYFGIWAGSPVDVKLAEHNLLNSGASKFTTTTTTTTTNTATATPNPLTRIEKDNVLPFLLPFHRFTLGVWKLFYHSMTTLKIGGFWFGTGSMTPCHENVLNRNVTSF